MKLGYHETLRFSRKEDKKETEERPEIEIGASGTRFFGGFYSDLDYNPEIDVSNLTGIYTIDEMIKGDATVRASLKIITLPLERANWEIVGGDEKIRQFVEDSLFEDMETDWTQLLGEILDFLAFGHSVFEKVFKSTEKGIQWHKWGVRLQRSIYKWEMGNGEEGIQQQLQGKEADEKEESLVDIPREKLIIFTHNKKGINLAGESILRSAHKHWYIKTQIEKIDAIAHERQGIGVPIITMPAGYNSKDVAEAEKIVKNWRANEESYVILPSPDWIFEISNNKAGETKDPHNSLQYHNRQILLNTLAQFLNLGAIAAGTRNVAQEQTEIFFLGEEAYGDYICSVVNESIKELVDLNFSAQKEYPKLIVSGIRKVDNKQFADIIRSLSDGKNIDKTEEDEEFLRKTFRLPLREGATVKEDQEEEQEFEDEEGKKKEKKEDKGNKDGTDQNKDGADQDIKKVQEKRKEEERIDKQSKKKVFSNLNESLRPSKREQKLLRVTRDLTKNSDRFYRQYFKEDLKFFKKKLQKILIEGYSQAPSEDRNGTEILVNDELYKNRMMKQIKIQGRKMKKKMIGKTRQDKIFKEVFGYLHEATLEFDKNLFKFSTMMFQKGKPKEGSVEWYKLKTKADKLGISIDEMLKTDPMERLQQMERGNTKVDKEYLQKLINSNDPAMADRARHVLRYVKEGGYFRPFAEVSWKNTKGMIALFKYNIEAWVDTQVRHILESIEDNFSSFKVKAEAVLWAKKLDLQEMIYRLSTLTHPEAWFRNGIAEWASERGIQYFKAVIPRIYWDDLAVTGVSASILFMIKTIEEWDKSMDADNVVSSMGIHHNARVFFYPIDEADFDYEERLAKQQRKDFLKYLKKHNK